ncbi:hypothetical protein MS3_00004226 [Schistosoma haematobium]|uniref:Uncharacterized protein n=1 Tax=Schistosoma haematobium TaxID=6185 RepID=A0A095C0K6_SCHHA|nr:hypothetical protein MS3_00004226 [Schistosoma haematobium]KAH9592212.1 hypothetical protein MS3_00004226 [Schistosoma haematobium]CAH8676111.1 unnamed protein product [Schistosoma haematobium]
MVQLFYYENRGIPCSHLLRNGMKKIIVQLEACENWPYPSSESKWLLIFNRFLRNWCKVIQMTSGGTKRYETIGHVTFTKLEGSMFITGKFKQDSAGKQQKMQHFCLFLTTNITDADFYRGYLLTGMVERGNRKLGIWESTHYAYVKREGY